MDEPARRREREVAGDAAPEALAAVLRDRLRAGKMTPDRVKLAAGLRHPAALALHPQAKPVSSRGVYDREDVLREARHLLGETLPARVAADWAELALAGWEVALLGDVHWPGLVAKFLIKGERGVDHVPPVRAT